MKTKPSCRKCGDTGLRQVATALVQCDCPMGAHFAGAPGQPAPQPEPDERWRVAGLVTQRDLDELHRLVKEGAAEIGRCGGENNALRSENARLQRELEEHRSAIEAGDKTVTALRERAELAETQRDNLQRELDAARAAAADTVRATTDSAKKAK